MHVGIVVLGVAGLTALGVLAALVRAYGVERGWWGGKAQRWYAAGWQNQWRYPGDQPDAGDGAWSW